MNNTLSKKDYEQYNHEPLTANKQTLGHHDDHVELWITEAPNPTKFQHNWLKEFSLLVEYQFELHD